MRAGSGLVIAFFLVACAGPTQIALTPSVPAPTAPTPSVPTPTAPTPSVPAPNVPTSQSSASSPPAATSASPSVWCYEVGTAPPEVSPGCEATQEECDAALVKARAQLGGRGAGNPFSECKPVAVRDLERPRRISGAEPIYSRQALEAGAFGKVVARCMLEVDGKLHSCVIVTSLSLMDQAVLDALTTWRCEPPRFKGRPVNMAYSVPFKFESR